jgi:hypothetical protein
MMPIDKGTIKEVIYSISIKILFINEHLCYNNEQYQH